MSDDFQFFALVTRMTITSGEEFHLGFVFSQGDIGESEPVTFIPVFSDRERARAYASKADVPSIVAAMEPAGVLDCFSGSVDSPVFIQINPTYGLVRKDDLLPIRYFVETLKNGEL